MLLKDYHTAYDFPSTPSAQLYFQTGHSEVWLYLPGSTFRYHIPSGEAFTNWGFNYSDIQEVGALPGVNGGVDLPQRPILITTVPEGKVYMAIPAAEVFPSGADMYYIESPTEFNNWHLNWSSIQYIDFGRSFDFPGPSQGFLENTPHLAVRGSGTTVYLVNDGLHIAYPIPSATVFNNWKFNWGSIDYMTNGAFDALYTTIDTTPLPSTPYLFYEEGNNVVFIGFTTHGGNSEIYWILSGTVFNNWKFNWSSIRKIPSHILYETYIIGTDVGNPVLP